MANCNIKDQYELPFDVDVFDSDDYEERLRGNPPLFMVYDRLTAGCGHYPAQRGDNLIYDRDTARATSIKLRIAADIIAQSFSWGTTIEGSEMWEHVAFSLEAMSDYLQEEFNLPCDYAEYRAVLRQNRNAIFEIEYAEDNDVN